MKTVGRASALIPGCDLWIVADPATSDWSRRIDWLLNFQLRRAGFHETRAIPAEVETIARDAEIEIKTFGPDFGPEASPLMVASGSLVPARQTVMVPFAESAAAAWVRACHDVWRDLGRPLTRVFLPNELPADAFSRLWPTDLDEGVRGDRALELV